MFRHSLLRLAAAAAVAVAGASNAFAQAAQEPLPAWDAAREAPAEAEGEDYVPVDAGPQDPAAPYPGEEQATSGTAAPSANKRASAAMRDGTLARNDVITAAEGVFGKGAEGLADLIEDLLRDQGEPSAYITGREASGAFAVGVRYGSGTLHHQIEGDRPVYWSGPSLGLDFGADASKLFVLVYNLHDSQRIFRRYPAAEGNAYVVGGFTASYLRRDDVVLIPIRMGVGLRLGVNAGYMRFSQKSRWLPF
jgi:hypothetical protein